MHLKKEEKLVKVFHHHYFLFLQRVLKYLMVSFPFFFVASFFLGILPLETMIIIYGSIAVFFIILIVYDGIIFFLDRLIVTNNRIIHIDWKSIFSREEKEVELDDIQNIETQENGIFSRITFLDYGMIRIETASSKVAISFENAPDPEGIKHFIYHLEQKPSKIQQK